MQIILFVLQLLASIAPWVAKALNAIHESQAGGLRTYDRLVEIAYGMVDNVSRLDFPGENQDEKNIKKYLEAVKSTAMAAEAIGIAVKDHQVMKAVQDAFVVWKQIRTSDALAPAALTVATARAGS